MRAIPEIMGTTIADTTINEWKRKPRTSVKEGLVMAVLIVIPHVPTTDLRTASFTLAGNQDGGGSVANMRLVC
jgi:hypothetical protein